MHLMLYCIFLLTVHCLDSAYACLLFNPSVVVSLFSHCFIFLIFNNGRCNILFVLQRTEENYLCSLYDFKSKQESKLFQPVAYIWWVVSKITVMQFLMCVSDIMINFLNLRMHSKLSALRRTLCIFVFENISQTCTVCFMRFTVCELRL